MSNPYPFNSVSLCGGALSRTTNMFNDTQQFTAVHPDGTTLLYLHLTADEADQWATVLTEYAEATK